jgi:hypothetical protein
VTGTSEYCTLIGREVIANDSTFVLLCIIAICFIYPVEIYVIYRMLIYVPPIVFMSLAIFAICVSLYFFSYVVYLHDRSAILGSFISIIFENSAWGLVSLSALPEMLKNCKEKLSFMDESSIADKICSLIVLQHVCGRFIVIIFMNLISKIIGHTSAIMLLGTFFLVLAIHFEYTHSGLRDYFFSRRANEPLSNPEGNPAQGLDSLDDKKRS